MKWSCRPSRTLFRSTYSEAATHPNHLPQALLNLTNRTLKTVSLNSAIRHKKFNLNHKINHLRLLVVLVLLERERERERMPKGQPLPVQKKGRG
jgi:hypothetical protein